jgi:tyrosine-protein phosphatase SIW14
MNLVVANLYRGARPTPAAFFDIKTDFAMVVSLEGPAEDELEQKELYPVRVVSDTITPVEIYVTGITTSRLDSILENVMVGMTMGKTLVHCEHGEDRTGLVIAAYRVLECGWSPAAAMDEAKRFGYHWFNFGLNKTWAAFEV